MTEKAVLPINLRRQKRKLRPIKAVGRVQSAVYRLTLLLEVRRRLVNRKRGRRIANVNSSLRSRNPAVTVLCTSDTDFVYD